jgi:hypothetical protein
MTTGATQKVEGALYPDEVTIAAAAFQAALTALDGRIDVDPHSVRRCLAEYISAHALMGELDVITLRDGALRYLGTRYIAPSRLVLRSMDQRWLRPERG